MPQDAKAGPPMRRVAIVGSTGSGKTTLATQLAERLNIPHVELDSLYWEAGWNPVSEDVFRARVTAALSDTWVTDGNYGQARDLIWGQADTLVWLDMPLLVALWRVVSRTLRRIVTHEVLWNDNRETVRDALLSRDSLLLYLFASRRKHKQQYPQLFLLPEYAHLRVVHLRSRRAVSHWLKTLPDAPAISL
ncbi:MAG: P-loop NTPase family protein [Anaerolineae bacterium]